MRGLAWLPSAIRAPPCVISQPTGCAPASTARDLAVQRIQGTCFHGRNRCIDMMAGPLVMSESPCMCMCCAVHAADRPGSRGCTWSPTLPSPPLPAPLTTPPPPPKLANPPHHTAALDTSATPILLATKHHGDARNHGCQHIPSAGSSQG